MRRKDKNLTIAIIITFVLIIIIIGVALNLSQKIEDSENINNPTARDQTQSDTEIVAEDDKKIEDLYTADEVAKHNKLVDCWVIHNNKVYEIPYSWTKEHPGGQEAFNTACGSDITEMFTIHTTKEPVEQLEKYYIGSIKE